MADSEEVVEAPRFSLDILATVKLSRSMNGLRHGDYQRYRQYCARRLRRVRTNKDVRFTYGRGRVFVQKELEPPAVTTVS